MSQDRVNTSKCAICRILRQDTNHWFLLSATAKQLLVAEWNEDLANVEGWRAACGEAHMQTLIARWTSHRTIDDPRAPLSQSVPTSFQPKGEEPK